MANLMERRITDLAAQMKLMKENNDRYVLLLGAGASISSEVPPTLTIISELLDQFGKMYIGQGGELDQFDKFWNQTADETKHQYLNPYLDQAPSEGYRKLADLIARGFIRLIVSFNFDILPQLAIESAGQTRALELVNGYDPVDQIEKQIDSDQAGVTIYQLHGSLRRPTSLKFSADDIISYDEETNDVLQGLTSRNIVVCGYAFEDYNVIKSFADFGKALWWVNPTEPPRTFKAIQRRRNSGDFVIGGEFGYFDNFFEKLHKELTQNGHPPNGGGHPSHNPFRFLASHKETDGKTLYYRAKSVRKLYDALQDNRPRTLHLSGKRMVGKTSLIRAGLLPLLSHRDFRPYYVRRCGAEIDKTLPEKIQRMTNGKVAERTIDDSLKALCKLHQGKHVVLILDQFERAISALGELPRDKATKTLDVLLTKPFDNLTVIPVFIVDVHFGDDLYFAFANEYAYIREKMYQDLKPLTQNQVRRIVHLQANRANVDIPVELLNQLVDQYDHKKFTLAHIETICHLLTARMNLDRQVRDEDLVAGSKLVTALNSALVDHDILSHLEDLPIPEEQNLLRNVLLAASNSSRQNIAEYLKDNFRVMHSDQL